jgi:hypothetical protein
MRPERRKAVTRLAAMPQVVRKTSAAVGAVAVAVAVAACGSDDEKTIPPDASEQLIAQLQEVESQVSAGRCELAQSEAQGFRSSVDQLPAEVGTETKEELRELANNLISLASNPDQCEAPEAGATGEDGVVPEETETTTTTTDETTTDTTSEDEPTKPEPAQPEPSAPEPENGGSEGPGGGGDVGGSIEGGGSSGGIGVKPKGEGG